MSLVGFFSANVSLNTCVIATQESMSSKYILPSLELVILLLGTEVAVWHSELTGFL